MDPESPEIESCRRRVTAPTQSWAFNPASRSDASAPAEDARARQCAYRKLKYATSPLQAYYQKYIDEASNKEIKETLEESKSQTAAASQGDAFYGVQQQALARASEGDALDDMQRRASAASEGDAFYGVQQQALARASEGDAFPRTQRKGPSTNTSSAKRTLDSRGRRRSQVSEDTLVQELGLGLGTSRTNAWMLMHARLEHPEFYMSEGKPQGFVPPMSAFVQKRNQDGRVSLRSSNTSIKMGSFSASSTSTTMMLAHTFSAPANQLEMPRVQEPQEDSDEGLSSEISESSGSGGSESSYALPLPKWLGGDVRAGSENARKSVAEDDESQSGFSSVSGRSTGPARQAAPATLASLATPASPGGVVADGERKQDADDDSQSGFSSVSEDGCTKKRAAGVVTAVEGSEDRSRSISDRPAAEQPVVRRASSGSESGFSSISDGP